MNKIKQFFLLSLISFFVNSCNFGKCEVTALVLIKENLNGNVNLLKAKKRITSPLIIQKAIEALEKQDIKDKPLSGEKLIENLEVNVIEDSRVISITYKHQNRETALKTANTLINVWIKNELLYRVNKQNLDKQANKNKPIEDKELPNEKIKNLRETQNQLKILPYFNSNPIEIIQLPLACKKWNDLY